MSNLALYELATQLRQLEALSDSDDLPAEVIADTLEALEGSFEDKAAAVGKFVLSLQANAQAVKDAAAAMKERSARIERRADQLKAYLLLHLQGTQRRKIERPDIVLRVQMNPPGVTIIDEAAIPAEYWVQPEPPPKRVDKKAILAVMKAGKDVPGAAMDQGEHLRISV